MVEPIASPSTALQVPFLSVQGPIAVLKFKSLKSSQKMHGLLSVNRTETLWDAIFVVTRSGFPSPFQSPIAIETGWVPTAKLLGTLRLPIPSPNRIETLFDS